MKLAQVKMNLILNRWEMRLFGKCFINILSHTQKRTQKLILENRVFKDIDMYKSLKYDIFIS